MEKLGPAGETALMRLSIGALSSLDTPIHNPKALPAAPTPNLATPRLDSPRERYGINVSYHTIMGLLVPHTLLTFSDWKTEYARDHVWSR
jgi:hypothetical protein